MLSCIRPCFLSLLKDDFEVEDAPQLLELISNVVCVERLETEAIIVLADRCKILATAARVTMLLLEHPDDEVATIDLTKTFEQTFGFKVIMNGTLYSDHINLIHLLRKMSNYVYILPSCSDQIDLA